MEKELIFVYGTLRDDRIQLRHLGHVLMPAQPSNDFLPEYMFGNELIDGINYPKAVPAERGIMVGVVYEVTAEDLTALDEYEGSNYTREMKVLASGREAYVYV